MNEPIKLKIKISSCLKNTNKDILMSGKDENCIRIENICQLWGKRISVDKVTDHCFLTGIYGVPAHQKHKFNVSQKHCKNIPFASNNFTNYDGFFFNC